MESITKILNQSSRGTDTEKFVALSVLHSVLDSPQSEIRNDSQALYMIWKLMPHKFVVRLLRSRPAANSSLDTGVSPNMNNLAIGILHTFTNLLAQGDLEDDMTTKYVQPLLEVLPVASNLQRILAYHTLQCLISTGQGRTAFLKFNGTVEILKSAIERDQSNLESVVKTLRAAKPGDRNQQREKWDDIVASIVPLVGDSPGLMLDMLTECMHEQEVIPSSPPSWLKPVLHVLKTSIIRRPNLATRTSSVMFAGALLQNGPGSWGVPSLLFCQPATTSISAKQFTNDFIKLLLVDIRASIPSLMSSLMLPSYSSTSLRLAMSYELLTAFLSLLLRSLDDAAAETDSTDSNRFEIEPDAILQLRHDMSETLANTIEYFRDRWDASFAGAAGLHASARIHTKANSSEPLQLSWDSASLPPAKDPIFLAGLRCLALWLCEDDNPGLQELTVGIMDLLVALYVSSTDAGNNDVRQPILMALSGVFPDDDALDAFASQDGWNILAKDLQTSVLSESHIEDLRSILDSSYAPR